jgi:CHAT domain-containing protein
MHFLLYEYEKARESYEEGLAIFCEIKDQLGEANCLKSLGDVHIRLSENEKALDSLEKALAIYRKIKSSLGEANTLRSLGHVHFQLSYYEKARESYEQGLAIFRKIKNRLGESNTLRSLGEVHHAIKEYEKARQKYEEAISLQKEIWERYEMVRSYIRLGQILETMNTLSAAEKAYTNSIDIIEDVWVEMKREEFKVPYLTSHITPYENLIHLLFKKGKGTQAFTYAERSKARSFLYLMGNKRIDIKKGVPLNLVRQEEELRQKITSLSRKIRENEEKEPARQSSTAQLNKELLQLKQTHSETLEKMKLLCPEYATLVSFNPLSTKDIQNLIRETGETVFLEYYTTPEAVYLWVLDGKNIFPYKIDINSETLAKKVQEYYAMISKPGTFGVETLEFQAQELFNLLLRDAENHWTRKNRIGIIPHGILHYLPFEALMNNGKFLEEQDITFFYLPSASVYKYCREKNPLKKEQFIALGNPDGSLVFSEKEVEELKHLYPRDTEIFTGKEAKETRVGYYGPYADILHFSCHGIFNAANPLYSALLLAPDNSADGRLEVQEIFQLNLKPAYLVTLSACETNVSNISPGDELVGLARAFIYAGTPSVLASLWKVDDYYTEKLMVSFYRALKNTDKITALHQARQEMIDKYGKRHPFYWAPFVLIGDFR